MTGRALLTLSEAAELLGISRRTLERRIAAGSLPVFRDGPRLMRIARSDLEAYVRCHTMALVDLVAPERVQRIRLTSSTPIADGRLWDAPDPLANGKAA